MASISKKRVAFHFLFLVRCFDCILIKYYNTTAQVCKASIFYEAKNGWNPRFSVRPIERIQEPVVKMLVVRPSSTSDVHPYVRRYQSGRTLDVRPTLEWVAPAGR